MLTNHTNTHFKLVNTVLCIKKELSSPYLAKVRSF